MVTTRSKAYQAPQPSKASSSTKNHDTTESETHESKKQASRADSDNKDREAFSKPSSIDNSDIQRLIDDHGDYPLSFIKLKAPFQAESETILAHILNAMLSSARISHTIATNTLKALVDAGYLSMDKLKSSSWQQRTEVLTEGGYTRYREKTATALGELEQLIHEKYDGDCSNFVNNLDTKDPKRAQEIVAGRVKEIKQLGELGSEIFLENCQMVVPELAPFISSRNLKLATQMKLGNETDMFKAVKEDATLMAKLCSALTNSRLEH